MNWVTIHVSSMIVILEDQNILQFSNKMQNLPRQWQMLGGFCLVLPLLAHILCVIIFGAESYTAVERLGINIFTNTSSNDWNLALDKAN